MAPGKRNPHLLDMKEDVLYHIGINSGTQNLKETFGDVKFVCMGGTPHRMEMFAEYLTKELGYKIPSGLCLRDISKASHRYSMFKVGPVLSVSHGMGVPSLSILLHEIFKLLWHAGVEDATFFRIGTCGGIGTEPGTVVVTTEAVDGCLRNVHETIVLGKIVGREAVIDQCVSSHLIQMGKGQPFKVMAGKTVCTHDFYEGQARLDGAFCEYTNQDKNDYIKHLQSNGVANIEMEATAFAALTHMAGFRSAVVCVTLVDRLDEDQIKPSKATMIAWQNRPGALVCRYIKQCLANGESTSPPSSVINRNGQKSNGSEDVVEAGDLNGTTNGRGSRHSSGRARSTSESSSTGQPDESYEDEVGAGGSVGAKMAGETLRGRYNSMSTIAGVRFDN